MNCADNEKITMPDRSQTTRNLSLAALVAVITAMLDQASKWIVLKSFQPGDIRPVIEGFFNLTLTFNKGAAFGLWSWLTPGLRELVLGLTILIAVGVVTYLLTRTYNADRISQAALALILGGAVGNVIDRVRIGAVVDFLDFYIGSWHWPAFNVADSAICLGVFALILFARQPATAKDC